MLFLLPPSETKRVGGSQPSIAQVAQTFGVLSPARTMLIDALVELCKDEIKAQRILKLGKKQLADVELNQQLWTQDTMMAVERYDGTLYQALGFQTLSEQAKSRAKEMLLIQSALFGLISSSDRIPNYRFSSNTVLPGISLKKFWSEKHEAVFSRISSRAPLIDLRSMAYAELAPIPRDIEHFWVEVITRDASGHSRALNHFNKKAKGEFMRAVLQSKIEPSSVAELKRIAKQIDFSLESDGSNLLLVIPGN